jgi:hypothetical protein
LDKLASATWYTSTTLFDYAEASKAEKNGTLQLMLDMQRRMREEGPSRDQHAKFRSRAPSPDLLQGHRHKKACAPTSSPEPQHCFAASRLRSNSVGCVQDCLDMAPPPSESGQAAQEDDGGDDALVKCKKRLERLDKLSRAIDVRIFVFHLTHKHTHTSIVFSHLQHVCSNALKRSPEPSTYACLFFVSHVYMFDSFNSFFFHIIKVQPFHGSY